jgi:hypothetical protein
MGERVHFVLICRYYAWFTKKCFYRLPELFYFGRFPVLLVIICWRMLNQSGIISTHTQPTLNEFWCTLSQRRISFSLYLTESTLESFRTLKSTKDKFWRTLCLRRKLKLSHISFYIILLFHALGIVVYAKIREKNISFLCTLNMWRPKYYFSEKNLGYRCQHSSLQFVAKSLTPLTDLKFWLSK